MSELTQAQDSPAVRSEPPQDHRINIEFTGSGSEYFRIWIVNILLLLVTLGIYYPWAKVRRLRYFYGNTLVDGYPLDFHANPAKMLGGYFLVGALFTLYSSAGNVSATAGFIAALIVTAIWPALLKSAMQFRMANTSWRGMRFRFNGSLPDAFRAALPMFVPGLVLLAAFIGVDNPEAEPPVWYFAVLGVTLLSALAVGPWLLWNLKQYQHNHYALATQQTVFKASAGSFYVLFLKIIGVALLPAVLIPLAGGLAFLSGKGSLPFALGEGGKAAVIAAVFAGFFGVMISTMILAKPYAISRFQNLIWTRTGNASLRFRSELRFKSMLGLTLKNWLLIVLTLGFYWPFAKVAMARMRLEAVTLKTRVDLDTLVSQLGATEGDAAGEAAGDFFGIDIGF